METLIVVEQRRDQYSSRIKLNGPVRFGSSHSKDFIGINCRSFQSGAGILPTPSKPCNVPVTKQACSFSPKTPSPEPHSYSHSDNVTHIRSNARSAPVPIRSKGSLEHRGFIEELSIENFSFPELWAGPTYSNSPPPSSLPMPKFSAWPKRTVSLGTPRLPSKVEVQPTAKSVPPSPTREHKPYTRDIFHDDDSATKTLCRILNLDLDDE